MFAAGRSMILRSAASSTLHYGMSAQHQQNHHPPLTAPQGTQERLAPFKPVMQFSKSR